MLQEDAIQLLQLKTQQYIKMIDLLNSQLDQSNNEKQELRLQIIALTKDNQTLRKERDNLQYQNNHLQEQIEKLEKEILQQPKQQKNMDEQQFYQQNSKHSFQSFLEEENKKIQEINSELLSELATNKNIILSLQQTKNQLEFKLEQLQIELEHKQQFIEKKDKYLKDNQEKYLESNNYYQNKIDQLQQKIINLTQQVINNDHTIISNEQQQQHQQSQQQQQVKPIQNDFNLNLSTVDKKLNQNINQKPPSYLDPRYNNVNPSIDRAQEEIQNSQPDSIGKNQVQQSIVNQGLRRQSNEQSQQQNGFPFKTQITESVSLGSQPKISERIKHSDNSQYY